eukprot:2156829-Amphidinium_carterae.1
MVKSLETLHLVGDNLCTELRSMLSIQRRGANIDLEKKLLADPNHEFAAWIRAQEQTQGISHQDWRGNQQADTLANQAMELWGVAPELSRWREFADAVLNFW